jgi:hypothetical protein
MNDRILNGQPKIIPTYEERGPDNAKEYMCTWLLGTDTIASGEWMPNKPDARLSAAEAAVPILRQWGYWG